MPTNNQATLIDKHIGAARFVYNLALECKQMAYSGHRVNLTCFDLIKQLPELKKECPWLKEINAQTLQQSISNLDRAFTAFFKGVSDFPRFKKKSNSGKFNIPQNVALNGDIVSIPKFKEGIKIIYHRPVNGQVKQATISRAASGKYFISILCDTHSSVPIKPNPEATKTVGIDLGIEHFLITSNGDKHPNPRHLSNSLSKLRFVQRKYSKHRGKRTGRKLACVHEKIANQRKDFLHKISTGLVKSHDSVAIETLQVSNMMKNHKMARLIQDAGWGEFVRMLEYKAEWNGKNIIKIGAFEPSSKMCSECGCVKKELALKDRKWMCSCGATHDRDVNAAINIKNFALRNYLSADRRLKSQNELPTLVGVKTSEARKSRSRKRFIICKTPE